MLARLAGLRPRSIYDVMAVIGCVAAVGTGTAYAANTVFSTDIVDGEVKNADIAANSITSNRIYPGSVQNTDIGADVVDSSKILNESLTSADLATNSVGASEIANGAVGNADLANSSVNGAKVATNSLTTADVAGTDANGTISLGAGAVASGRCKSFDIAIGGAKANETLVISARAALPAGLIIYGQRVPADGQGTMTVCNLSGSPMPALSSFPIRTVTFG